MLDWNSSRFRHEATVTQDSQLVLWCPTIMYCIAEAQPSDALTLQPEITLLLTLVLLQNKAAELVSEKYQFLKEFSGISLTRISNIHALC